MANERSDELDALVAENARLAEEARKLRERVHAFERSRWHRLHPRRVFVTQRPESPADVTVAPRRVETDTGSVDTPLSAFRSEVVERGTFTEDWLGNHVDMWEPVLRRLEGRGAEILEIGSYEGLSACYLLWRLEDATITCVDTFTGSPGMASFPGRAETEARFDANVALVGERRVHKRVGDSRRVLVDLVAQGARFNLVYVDGSHLALDVLIDAAYSWRLLEPSGVLMFDDYRYETIGEDPLLRPGPAIDAFLSVIEGKYEEVFRGYQLAVRKLPITP